MYWVDCVNIAKSLKSQAPQGFSGCLDIGNDEMNKKMSASLIMIHFHKIPPSLDAFLSPRIFTRNGEPTHILHMKRTLNILYFMRCSKNHEATIGRRQARIKRVGFIAKM